MAKQNLQLTSAVIDNITERWLADLYCENRIKESTAKTYRKAMQAWKKFLREQRKLKPQRRDVAEFFALMRDRRREPSYINLLRSALKGFFAYAANAGLYPDIARNIRMFKIPRGHRRKALYPYQVQELLNSVPEGGIMVKRDLAMLALIATSGIRAAACCGLRIQDFRETADCEFAVTVKLKGYISPSHEIPVCVEVSELIRDYLATRPKAKPSSPLFQSARGRFLSPGRLSKIFRDVLHLAGIDGYKVSLHSLRHSFATTAKANGIPLEIVSDLLGHASVSTTADIYDHREKCSRREAVEKVAELVGLSGFVKFRRKVNDKTG